MTATPPVNDSSSLICLHNSNISQILERHYIVAKLCCMYRSPACTWPVSMIMTGSLITSCVIGHTYSAGHPVFVRCIVGETERSEKDFVSATQSRLGGSYDQCVVVSSSCLGLVRRADKHTDCDLLHVSWGAGLPEMHRVARTRGCG